MPMKRGPRAAMACGALLLAVLAGCSQGGGSRDAGPAVDGATTAATAPLLPLPMQVQPRRGRFALDSRVVVLASGGKAEESAAAQDLARLLARSGLPAPRTVDATGTAGDAGAIRFTLDPAADVAGDEGYLLDVTRDGIDIRARTGAGLYYGAVTAWQLASASRGGGPVVIPAQRITDAPRFAWRGLMLDSARHFQTVDEIKSLLDAMSEHKLNTFHWHLTDDQGWRIEIPKHPRLTTIGGCRIPAGDGGRDPRTGKPRPYCGFYTQAQIREVVAHAARRHITVVPEIDLPGHATAAIAAYPWLGVDPKRRVAVSNEWGVNENLFNVEEKTFALLEDVLAEVIALFPGEVIHIGGDEAVKDQWERSPRVQARMRELGAKDEAAMQALFVARMDAFLESHGRRAIGWDEVLDGDLPADTLVMSWRGGDGAVAAASRGHDVVMAPNSDVYLDYLQTGSPDEPPGRPATITLQEVYAFEPVPANLPAADAHHIVGVQANSWTEHMRDFGRVQHAVFPRIAALAETAWSPRAAKDWDGFVARLPAQLARYDDAGIAYAKTPFGVRVEAEAPVAGRTRITLSNPLQLTDLRYTTDGSAPTPASPRYDGPFAATLPVDVRAAAFGDGRALAPATVRAFDATSHLLRDSDALRSCHERLVLRLEDDGPLDGPREVFKVDIFDPCWLWSAAPLDGISAIEVRAGRLPYLFQLAHDEKHRGFQPKRSRHGEVEVLAGCDGRRLAELKLPAKTGADGFTALRLPLPADAAEVQDLCIRFTGDTRPAMWVVDTVRLVPR